MNKIGLMFCANCANCKAPIPCHRVTKKMICKNCSAHLRANTTQAFWIWVIVCIPLELAIMFSVRSIIERVILKCLVAMLVFAWSFSRFSDVNVDDHP